MYAIQISSLKCNTYKYKCKCTHVHIYRCICICRCISMYIYIYVYIYVYIYICMYIYIYIRPLPNMIMHKFSHKFGPWRFVESHCHTAPLLLPCSVLLSEARGQDGQGQDSSLSDIHCTIDYHSHLAENAKFMPSCLKHHSLH